MGYTDDGDFDFEYTANNTFAQVHMDPAKYLFIRGSVGSGKSSGCILHCFLNALEQPPGIDGVRRSKYAVLRASYPNLKSTTIDSWINDWFGPLINVVYDIPIRGEILMDHPDGKTKVEMKLIFLALDREEDVNKLQSLQCNGAHLNEAAEIPRGVFQMLKSRVNRYPRMRTLDKIHPDYRDQYKPFLNKFGKLGAYKPFIIHDYNSIATEHWLYKIAEEEKPDKHAFYTQPPALLMCPKSEGFVEDAEGNWYKFNPEADNLENLNEDYYIDQCQGADPDWISVFVLNNYGSLRAGKPVYKMYNDKIHYSDKPYEVKKGLPIIVGVDTGLTPAAAFMQLTTTGELVVFDEIVTEDTSIHEFAYDHLWPLIRNKYKGFRFEFYVDPENKRGQTDKKTAKDIMIKSGLPVSLGKTNNPAQRFESVVFFLRKVSGFRLTPDVPVLRKGFISEFKFEKVSTTVQGTKWKEKPEKNIYSHIHEALQYGAMEFVEGKIFRKNVMKKQNYTGPADSTAGY
jgi:hypothetical protein